MHLGATGKSKFITNNLTIILDILEVQGVGSGKDSTVAKVDVAVDDPVRLSRPFRCQSHSTHTNLESKAECQTRNLATQMRPGDKNKNWISEIQTYDNMGGGSLSTLLIEDGTRSLVAVNVAPHR
jgi:hypothetical protein